jgi:hypothetical protein
MSQTIWKMMPTSCDFCFCQRWGTVRWRIHQLGILPKKYVEEEWDIKFESKACNSFYFWIKVDPINQNFKWKLHEQKKSSFWKCKVKPLAKSFTMCKDRRIFLIFRMLIHVEYHTKERGGQAFQQMKCIQKWAFYFSKHPSFIVEILYPPKSIRYTTMLCV